MHTLTFEMKRAHLASIRLTRRLCAQVGLTPARLDMLRAIFANCNAIQQSVLRHHLGVTKTVVSIMVRALEKLGFVRRTRSYSDGRTFDLTVLVKGRIALRRIHYESRTVPYLDMAFASAFCEDHVPNDTRFATIHALERGLLRFRTAFGLPSPDEPPWTWNIDDGCFYYGGYTDNLSMVDLVPDPETDDHLDDDENFIFITDDDRPCGVERIETTFAVFTFLDWMRFQRAA